MLEVFTCETPLGNIEITLDGAAVAFEKQTAPPNSTLYPNVDGAFFLTYKYVSDKKPHVLKCCLNSDKLSATPETGERLESIAFYTDNTKLSIATEGEFGLSSACSEYDYDGALLSKGIEIAIFPKTKNHAFVFGVALISPVTDENDVQTWFAADPTIKR